MTLPTITSLSNQRIKYAVSLRESRKRRRTGEFLIDGVREVTRAQKSGIRLKEAYVAVDAESADPFSSLSVSEEFHSLLNEFEKKRFPVWPVLREVFTKTAFGDRDEGIVVLAEEPKRSFEIFESRLSENPLICVLEKIEKPGNIGAVFRSADGAGLDGIILADCGYDLWHPNTIRSSLGTVFRVPSVTATAAETAEWLKRRHIYAASAICDASIPYSEADFTVPTAIVLGNEAFGLTELWHNKEKLSEGSVSIVLPMCGIADSLNISNAAAILFYHAHLQRDCVKGDARISSSFFGKCR